MDSVGKPSLISVENAAIFGAGFLAASFIFRRVLPKLSSPRNGISVDFAEAAKLAAIRASRNGRSHKMVFVVRTDLNMGKGKIAAQCSHAAIMCYQRAMAMDQENLDIWEATGVTKICLKADGDESCLKELQKKAKEHKIVCAIVRDAGHTQIAPGTYTVLGIGPFNSKDIDEITGHLKLM